MYGLYDSYGEGITFYETEEDRAKAAEETIESYLSENEWSDEVVNVLAFEVTHRATAVNVKELVGKLDEDGCDETGEYWESSEFDYKCNYELQPFPTKIES